MTPAVPRSQSTARTLRLLFLTLFLRGRSSRGLNRESAPKPVGRKLARSLALYAFFGMFALFLLHRPIEPRQLLWAKAGVLVEVSLWLSFALNLAGFFIGFAAPGGGWRFPIVHAMSTTLEALFCTGCVVLAYQLCLRWFGRERLDGLMTMAQVTVSVAAVMAGQLLPRLVDALGGEFQFTSRSWWIVFLPPVWFAGFDDALGGQGATSSWFLASIGLAATAAVAWTSFGKLARDYNTGLQILGESSPAPRRSRSRGRHWIDVLIGIPPFRWWLRNPVSRASFLLTTAYLVRDRDVKLRVYPGLAPVLVMPIILMMNGTGSTGGIGAFGVAFSGCYLGVVPMIGLNLLQYSQQWQASDVFRASPMRGPAQLCHGARRAVLFLLTLPLLLVSGLLAWLMHRDGSQMLLLLPGFIALPVYAMVPSLGGNAVPLSLPTEAAKAAGRGLRTMAAMFFRWPSREWRCGRGRAHSSAVFCLESPFSQ